MQKFDANGDGTLNDEEWSKCFHEKWPLVKNWGDNSKRAKFLGVLKGMDSQHGKLFTYIKQRGGAVLL